MPIDPRTNLTPAPSNTVPPTGAEAPAPAAAEPPPDEADDQFNANTASWLQFFQSPQFQTAALQAAVSFGTRSNDNLFVTGLKSLADAGGAVRRLEDRDIELREQELSEGVAQQRADADTLTAESAARRASTAERGLALQERGLDIDAFEARTGRIKAIFDANADPGFRVVPPSEWDQNFIPNDAVFVQQNLKNNEFKVTRANGTLQELYDSEGNLISRTVTGSDVAGQLTKGTQTTRQKKSFASKGSLSAFKAASNILESSPDTIAGVTGSFNEISNKFFAPLGFADFEINRGLFVDTINRAVELSLRNFSEDSRFTKEDRRFVRNLVPSTDAFPLDVTDARLKLAQIVGMNVKRLTWDTEDGIITPEQAGKLNPLDILKGVGTRVIDRDTAKSAFNLLTDAPGGLTPQLALFLVNEERKRAMEKDESGNLRDPENARFLNKVYSDALNVLFAPEQLEAAMQGVQ